MAATAANAGSIPETQDWYDWVEDGASFLFDWLVQENTAYAPETSEEANDPNKRSMSDEEHALLSGMFWGAGRIAAPVVESLGPFVRRFLPNGVMQALVDPVLAGGTMGTTGAVGSQVVDDAVRGEVSDADVYLDQAASGLAVGLGIGGLGGLVGLPKASRVEPHVTPPEPQRVPAPSPRQSAHVGTGETGTLHETVPDKGGPVGTQPGDRGPRYHSVYEDGQLVPEGAQPDRLPNGADPKAEGAHSRVRWDEATPSRSGEGRGRVYQGREFDADGNPVRDIDFTSPTYPSGRPRPDHLPPPHQHEWLPNDPANPRAGYRRSKKPTPFVPPEQGP
jgi:hypothetical protein